MTSYGLACCAPSFGREAEGKGTEGIPLFDFRIESAAVLSLLRSSDEKPKVFSSVPKVRETEGSKVTKQGSDSLGK